MEVELWRRPYEAPSLFVGTCSHSLVTMERDSGDERRRDRERIMVQEGTELWKQKKRDQWAQKIADQREVRKSTFLLGIALGRNTECRPECWVTLLWIYMNFQSNEF
jgi:hypothetical protein